MLATNVIKTPDLRRRVRVPPPSVATTPTMMRTGQDNLDDSTPRHYSRELYIGRSSMDHHPSVDAVIKSRNSVALPRDPDSQKSKRYPRDNRDSDAIGSGKYRSTGSNLGGIVFYCSAFDRSLAYSDRLLLGIRVEMTKAIHSPPPSAPARTSVGKCIPR